MLGDDREATAQELAEVVGVRRLGEQVALAKLTINRSKQAELVRLLDTLTDGLQAHRAPERDQRLGEIGCLTAVAQLTHERAVDLDDVDREAKQMAHRRVAGTEVIERDAYAQLAKLLQLCCRRLQI